MTATATDRLNGITTSVAVKPPCRTVSTVNLTLSGLQTVNGVALEEGNRVLVKGQTNQTQNGIYLASTSGWTRTLDFDGNRDVVRGTLVVVDAGNSSGVLYRVTTANPIIIGTSNIVFSPIDIALPAGHLDNYDAAGDGSTNDTAAINAALAANAGRSIILRDGATYKITSELTVPVNTDIVVENNGVATIDGSSASLLGATALITCAGTLGSILGGGLASTVSAGAVSATLNSAPTLSPGDLVILRNTVDASWNGDSAGDRQGEFLVVKSVSGAVVVFTSAVIDSYASTVTCGLYKVTPTTTRISGKITIIGNTADTNNIPTLYFHYGRDNLVEGVTFRTTTATCLEMNVCYKPVVRHIDTGKYLTDAGAIQSTGVTLASCQYGRVYDSILAGDRHGGSTGGGGTVVDRFNVFEHCAISARTASAADFHGNAEFCEYRNCHIDGGVNLSGARNKLIGNRIFPHASVTSLINMEANKSIDHEILDNRFHMRGAVVRYVMDANASTDINANTGAGTLLIRGNRIIDDTALDQSYFFIRNNGSTADIRIEFESNRITKSDTTKYGNVLAVSVVSGSNFAKISYRNNTHENTGFGVCSGVDAFKIEGSLGVGPVGSSSPTFGTTLFEPSYFNLEKTIAINPAGTSFTLFDPTSGNSFVPSMVSARVNVDTTATTGEFLAVGVNANNRRADFGVFANAAASSKHAKNSMLRFVNSSELANQAVVAGEVLALNSIGTNADNAAIGSNIGGSASMTVTVRLAGYIVGNMPTLP